VTGLSPFSIEKSENFQRSFRKLSKAYNKGFVGIVVNLLEALLDDPYPSNSRDEPLPSKMKLPEGWTFHKLELRVSKGASGQIRLMYLVNESAAVIIPLWIYSHEQFVKRPADKELRNAIQEALDP
jgi:mRNA-degrading endonuclease YafQ of YafQ-DinJ toxin-antitoxin module